MEAILKNVSTDQLEEGYKTFIGRVLREADENGVSSEKEGSVLAEGTSKKVEKDVELAVETGDDDVRLEEEELEKQTSKTTLSESELMTLKKLAGIN
jgi:hypothetical protein